MAITLDGFTYTINYRNTNINSPFSKSVSISGDTFSSETIWTLANGLLPAVKSVWFETGDTVVIDSIQSYGDMISIRNPFA